MTLQEIFQRIIRAHWVVIVVCALVPVAAVALLQTRQSPEYVGSVRIQVVSSAPASTTEAEALSSRVLALATTPTLVARALDSAGLTGDASDVALHHVTASRLGESPVVDVAVTDPSPARARTLAAALVQQVVAFMNNGSRPALDVKLTALDKAVAATDAQRGTLTARLPLASSKLERERLVLSIQAAQDKLNQLSLERSNLLSTKLSVDQAVVIDGDNPQVHQVPSSLVPRSLLALVLGLIVAVAVAVLIETLAPRVAGVRSLARTLGAPLLGHSNEPTEELAASITMAARRQGVETVVVMGLEEKDAAVVGQLLKALPTAGAESANVRGKMPAKVASTPSRNYNKARGAAQRQPLRDPFATLPVAFCSLTSVDTHSEHTAGVVVISSGTSRTRDLDRLEDRLTALRWPVVGIVQATHKPSPARPLERASEPSPS